MTRAAMWTAIPAICPSWSSTSPLCNPARISIPSDRTAAVISAARYRSARATDPPPSWISAYWGSPNEMTKDEPTE
jgi:hypothetical protein